MRFNFKRLGSMGVTAALAAASLSLFTAGAAEAATSDGISKLATSQLGNGPCGNGGYYAPGSNQTNPCSSYHAWCADFAGWVWAQNGVKNLGGLNDLANSFETYANNYDGGLSSTPHVGDAVFLHPNNYSGFTYDHVAIVTSVNSDGTIDWVGGNQHNQVERTHLSGRVGTKAWSSGGGDVVIQGYARPVGLQNSSLMRLDTVVAGNVWDNQRNTDGTWTGAGMIDAGG
uniref:CHAP domain-containing protein n=1 Tax=Streptomyces sp. NRRL WC-3742 TaxID=1463934 RepID=UPI0004CA3165